MTTESVEGAVSQLKRREDAPGLHAQASGLEGGHGTAVPIKTRKSNLRERFA